MSKADEPHSQASNGGRRFAVELASIFYIAAILTGCVVQLLGAFQRAELQTINQRFEARRWLRWHPQSLQRLNIATLWMYHEKHEIPKQWWAWDYTLSWLTENNHPPINEKIVIFNHSLEDEPPPGAVASHPWMHPLLAWPLSRATVAEMVRTAAKDGAKLIILDIEFPQYSTDDPALARAISDCASGKATGKSVPVMIVSTINRSSSGELVGLEVPSAPSGILNELRKLEPNVDVQKKYTGITGVWQDEDQVVRALASRIHGQHGEYESLALKAFPAVGRQLPPDVPDTMDIDFAGPPNSELYPVRPYSYLLDPERQKAMVSPEPGNDDVTLKGAIVLIGDGVVDVFNTPTTNVGFNQMSGTEILANAIDTISKGSWLHRVPTAVAILWICFSSLFGAGMMLLWRKLFGRNHRSANDGRAKQLMRLASDMFCLFLTAFLIVLFACLVFTYDLAVMPIIPSVVAVVIGTVAVLIWERDQERMESLRQRVRDAEEKLVLTDQIHRAELEAQAAHAEAMEASVDKERRRQFARRINHDLKAPIGVLNWTITKLLKVGLGSAKAPEQLERIAHSSDRLNGLIDELAKTYVEPSPDERASSSPAVCDLNEIVDNCCKMLRTLAEERQSEIEGLTSTTPTKVNARALEMSRAIDNLVRNALLHNKPGCTVKVTVQPGSDSHKVTVTDNGQGIAPEHLDKIFEAGFSTNSAASSKSSDHQGLGLHIVKTLVEATGGSIQVESQLAQGTTFTITLPSADLPVSAPSMPETTTAPN